MIETKEKPDVAETDFSPRRKDSANVMLTVKLMIITTVLLGVLWILDALVAN